MHTFEPRHPKQHTHTKTGKQTECGYFMRWMKRKCEKKKPLTTQRVYWAALDEQSGQREQVNGDTFEQYKSITLLRSPRRNRNVVSLMTFKFAQIEKLHCVANSTDSIDYSAENHFQENPCSLHSMQCVSVWIEEEADDAAWQLEVTESTSAIPWHAVIGEKLDTLTVVIQCACVWVCMPFRTAIAWFSIVADLSSVTHPVSGRL